METSLDEDEEDEPKDVIMAHGLREVFIEQIRGMFFLCKFGVRVVYKSRPRENSLVLKEGELPKQQQDQNEKVKMPKDKKKEAERQRGIILYKSVI